MVLVDWNEKAVRSAADELSATGHKILAVWCDVSDDAQVEAMVEQAIATFGRLDAAYNNAGVQNILAETVFGWRLAITAARCAIRYSVAPGLTAAVGRPDARCARTILLGSV